MSKQRKLVCVIGLGHFGRELAVALAKTCEVLALDRSQNAVDEIADKVHRALAVDVRDEEALASVIPEHVDEAVISMGENLESSILCTLYLKRLEVPVIRVKALTDDHAVVLQQVGADEVIFPERETARRLAARIVNPNLLDFVPVAGDYQVMEVRVPTAFVGRTLAEINLRARYNVFVISILRPDPEGMQFLPGPDMRLLPDDVLFMIGTEEDLGEVQKAKNDA